MKSSTVVACTVFIAAMLVGVTQALNYKCYSCNSGSNPAECRETFGPTSILVEKKENCTCCNKQKASDVWTRSCGTNTDCFLPQIDKWICFGELCNAGAPIKVQGIVVALTAALGLVAYMRY